MNAFDRLELSRNEFIKEILEKKPDYNIDVLKKIYIATLMQTHYEIVFNEQENLNDKELEIELLRKV
jgi:hypothetical protein